eukprot:67981-Amphidinium_carterae.2
MPEMFSKIATHARGDRAPRGLVAIDYEGVDSAARPLWPCDDFRRILAQDVWRCQSPSCSPTEMQG